MKQSHIIKRVLVAVGIAVCLGTVFWVAPTGDAVTTPFDVVRASELYQEVAERI